MDDFYAARDTTLTSLPWPSIAPPITVPVTGNFKANSPLAIANMAADGLGVGRVLLYTAEPFLKDGRLQLLFESQEIKVSGLYAVYPPSRHLTARIRALIDHLAEQF